MCSLWIGDKIISAEVVGPGNKTLASPGGDYNLSLENRIRRLENEIDNMKLNESLDRALKWYL